jgi:hypothetical protein
LTDLGFFPSSKEQHKEQQTEPIISVSKREEKVTAQLAFSSTAEQEIRSSGPALDGEEVRVQSAFLPPTTEARLRAVPARPALQPSPLPSSEQQTTTQNTGPLKRIRLRRFIVVGLFCLAMLGAGAFAYTGSSGTAQNGPVVVHQPVAAGQQGNSSLNNALPETRTIAVGAYPFITIKGHKGNVSISAGGAGSVVIKASNNSKNLASTIGSKGIQYTQSRDKQGRDFITIVTMPVYNNVNYNVSAPSSALVKVEVDSGSIVVNGVSGVNIVTTNGSLNIENVSGPIEVSTENGDITGNNIKGQMTMQTVHGSIRDNNVNGQLKAVTQDGDVIVKQATLYGQSILKTQYGSVRFTGTIDRRGTYTMGTQSGDVDLTLSAPVAFQLHASTNSGSVSNELGSNDIGDAPQAQITITIGSGSVVVKRAV